MQVISRGWLKRSKELGMVQSKVPVDRVSWQGKAVGEKGVAREEWFWMGLWM
jgi:hypothetical protein